MAFEMRFQMCTSANEQDLVNGLPAVERFRSDSPKGYAVKYASFLCISVVLLAVQSSSKAERITVSLDGQWTVEEGIEGNAIPVSFPHTVPVPGLTRQARPSFPDVDHYETRDYVNTMIKFGVLPPSERFEGLGRTRQKRKYFWYQKTFSAPAPKQSATLLVGKAQFGTTVWLNGTKVGEHLGCFTAGRFDVTRAIRWNEENSLIVRIGAHPGVMPPWAPWGNDGEKVVWTPGIYDSVSLILADPPVIDSVQVAPRIASSEIVLQTRLKNPGAACVTELVQQVSTWKDPQAVSDPIRLEVSLAAGEEKTVIQTLPISDATLWSPDNPFLYVLKTSTDGDDCATRFGMREFRFDTATRRAYLNGKICFLRGASITLHRFFGDPLCESQPWDEAWVRRLLVDLPRQMHWNAFRICIGPAPQKWLDIADEAGLLLQWEFPVWSDRDPWYYKQYREDEIIFQFKQFMRDNWNHPSVAIWDASNETHWNLLSDKVIPAVRGLDLSKRPWENGYNPPQGADDPCEDHPYLFSDHLWGKKHDGFRMTRLETMSGSRRGALKSCSGHAAIINEYDWLWLHRDGTPTVLSAPVYRNLGLLGPQTTTRERFEQYAYMLGGLTEYWRAYRNYAGVLYLAYLDGDLPNCFTCDNFRDVQKLELEPHFADYMSEAFKPLGVYVNFWQPELPAGEERYYRVMLVNDEQQPARGKLELSWQRDDTQQETTAAPRPFKVAPLGQMTYDVALTAPTVPGKYILMAKAYWEDKSWSPTVSRRKVQIVISAAASSSVP